jgi:FixJ family two-component response regulator
MFPEQRTVVAVIDDNPEALRALRHLLAAYGYEPEIYSSSHGFLEAALTSRASCLIIDVQLGATSGFDLAQQLKEAGFRIPTIFMTGRDNEEIRRRAIEVGCVACVSKPISAEVLMDAVITALR